MTRDQIRRKWGERRKKWRTIHWATSAFSFLETVILSLCTAFLSKSGSLVPPEQIFGIFLGMFQSAIVLAIWVAFLESYYDRKESEEIALVPAPSVAKPLFTHHRALNICTMCGDMHETPEALISAHRSMMGHPFIDSRMHARLRESVLLAQALKEVRRWRS